MYIFFNVLMCCILHIRTYITWNHSLNSNSNNNNKWIFGHIYFKKGNYQFLWGSSVSLLNTSVPSRMSHSPEVVLNMLFIFSFILPHVFMSLNVCPFLHTLHTLHHNMSILLEFAFFKLCIILFSSLDYCYD